MKAQVLSWWSLGILDSSNTAGECGEKIAGKKFLRVVLGVRNEEV